MNTNKQAALWTIKQLPDDASFEDIIDALGYTFTLRRRVEEGIRDADEGRVVPHEEVVRELAEWLQSIGQTPPDGISEGSSPTLAETQRRTRKRSANAS